MADPFVAEIRIFPFYFAPKNWSFCDGQILLISQNTALFSLLGTNYGGNGTSTFALPDLQGRAPMFYGQGVGLSARILGESAGEETVTLSANQMPAHNHALGSVASAASTDSPAVSVLAESATLNTTSKTGAQKPMASDAIMYAGSSQPHNNMQPFLVFNFCIALTGVFPSRP